MSFETPIQRVPAGPTRIAIVFAGLVAAAGMLVWQPWSAGPGAAPLEASPSPPVTGAAPSAIPTIGSSSLPLGGQILPEASLPLVPTADRFRPRWSVVGVIEQPGGNAEVTQLPVVLISDSLEGRSAEEICEIGRARSAMVAMLTSDGLRLIGISAPAAELDGPVEIAQIDGPLPAAYEIPVPAVGTGDARGGVAGVGSLGSAVAATRLFLRSDLLPWPGGAYRFTTTASDGAGHSLYACATKGATAGW